MTRRNEMTEAPAALRDGDNGGDSAPVIHIQLLHVPDCSLVHLVRATLRRSLSRAKVRVAVEEVEGPYPSPTLLIDGADVTGRSPAPGPSCRLDLPTEDQVLVALRASNPEPEP